MGRHPLKHNGATTATELSRFDSKGVPHRRFSRARRYVEEPFATVNFGAKLIHALGWMGRSLMLEEERS